MEKMQGIWSRNQAKYSSGENYRIGKIDVGAWFNPVVRKGEPAVYRAQVNLPGMKMKEGTTDFPDAEQARKRVESAVATWFKWIYFTIPTPALAPIPEENENMRDDREEYFVRYGLREEDMP